MARPRKPTKVLELSGAFRHDPARARDRANEPRPDGAIGDPPADTPMATADSWRDLVRDALPGVLTSADRPFVLYASAVVAEMEADIRGGRPVNLKLSVRLEVILGKLGMTPADRQRVAAATIGRAPAASLDEFRR